MTAVGDGKLGAAKTPKGFPGSSGKTGASTKKVSLGHILPSDRAHSKATDALDGQESIKDAKGSGSFAAVELPTDQKFYDTAPLTGPSKIGHKAVAEYNGGKATSGCAGSREG